LRGWSTPEMSKKSWGKENYGAGGSQTGEEGKKILRKKTSCAEPIGEQKKNTNAQRVKLTQDFQK